MNDRFAPYSIAYALLVVSVEAFKLAYVHLAREAGPVALAGFPPALWIPLRAAHPTNRAGIASIVVGVPAAALCRWRPVFLPSFLVLRFPTSLRRTA